MVGAIKKLPKPGGTQMSPEEEAPTPDVECGDELYFRHPKHGPTHGAVAAHGRDGCLIDCAADSKRYRVRWQHVLGHRVKVQQGYKVVDQGEDGFIAADESGRRRYIHDPDPDVAGGDEEPIRKAFPLLFGSLDDVMKAVGGARYIKNRPGLALQDVTDKRGGQTKRWKKTGQEIAAPKQSKKKSEEPAPKHPVGAEVSFKAGGKPARGKVVTAGVDGAVVSAADGTQHKVYWHEMRGKSAKSAPSQHAERPASRPSTGSAQIPAEHFKAHDYASKFDDPNVTPDSVLDRFPPEVKEKMQEVDARAKAVTHTDTRYKRDGKWDAARARKHREIIDTFMSADRVAAAAPRDGAAPTLTMLGGRGGSGKGSFEGQVYDPDKAIVLDADVIKKKLPEYEGWNAAEVHAESSELLDTMAEMCREMKLNVVIDATMKSHDSLMERARAFKSDGFRLEAHYMFLPRADAAHRSVKRFLGKTGRYVPVRTILENVSNEANFDAVRQMADKWSFHDNRGDAPVLISEGGANDTGKGK